MKTDQQLGRNRYHRYTLDERPPLKLKKDGTPYAKQAKPNYSVPSVTTITGQLGISSLPWASSKVAAEMAVKQPQRWQHLPAFEAVDTLRREFDRKWGLSRNIGTIVHDAAHARAIGGEYDPLEAFEMLATADEDYDGQLAKLDGHLTALDKFWTDQEPKVIFAEQTCARINADSSQQWMGSFDASGSLKVFGDNVLWDFKTGGKYDDALALQLTGYAMATHLTEHDEDGWLVNKLAVEAPRLMLGVYLQDDGTYLVQEVKPDPRLIGAMNSLARTWYAMREVAEWGKEHAAQPF